MKNSRKVPGISACAAKRESLDVPAAFLEELIDDCVLAASEAQIISRGNRAKPGSLYFPEEAAAKNLRFIDPVSALLNVDGASCSVLEADGTRLTHASEESTHKPIPTKQDASSTLEGIRSFIEGCAARKLGENLNRLETASPDLFAVISQEGKV